MSRLQRGSPRFRSPAVYWPIWRCSSSTSDSWRLGNGFLGVYAPDVAAPYPTADVAGFDLAPGAAAFNEPADDARLGARNNRRVRLRLPKEQPHTTFDDDGALAAQHALMHPAGCAFPVADAAPMLELPGDLDRHLLARQHPLDRVAVAGAGAQIDLVGMQADETRHRQARLPFGGKRETCTAGEKRSSAHDPDDSPDAPCTGHISPRPQRERKAIKLRPAKRQAARPQPRWARLAGAMRRTGAASRAVRIFRDSDAMKLRAQRVVDHQGAVEAVAEPEQFLLHLDGLQRAHDPSDRTEDAGLFAARHEVGRRRLAEETAVTGVARAEIGAEARQLPLERRQRGGDQRLLEMKAEFRQQIARREIVAAVRDNVIRSEDRLGIFGAKAHGMGFDADAVIDGAKGGPRAVDLERPDAFGGMHDLALQISQIDPVVVDDADRPDTGGGKIQQHRRAEPAGPDDQHARLQELFLPLLADLVEDQVAGISLKLLFAEFHGRADRGGTNAVRCGPDPSFRQRSQSSAGRSETAGLASAGSGEVGHDAELRPRGARKDELGDAVAGLDQNAFFGIFRSRVAVPR